MESLERKVARYKKTIKALGRQFKRVVGMVKVKLRGVCVQAVRDFLSSGSHKSRLISAKGDEFSAGFQLAVDQAIRHRFLPRQYNSSIINEERNIDGSERPLVGFDGNMNMGPID